VAPEAARDLVPAREVAQGVVRVQVGVVVGEIAAEACGKQGRPVAVVAVEPASRGEAVQERVVVAEDGARVAGKAARAVAEAVQVQEEVVEVEEVMEAAD
jgi:hypothetical protein